MVFRLDPATLPSPTQLIIEQWGVPCPHGVPFDPKQLQQALQASDNVRATAIIHGDNSSPTSSSGDVLANAPTTASGKPSASTSPSPAATDRVVVRIETKVDAGPSPKPVIDLDNNLVKQLLAELDGASGVRSSKDILGDFPLSLATKTSYKLKIYIPTPPSPPSSPGLSGKVSVVDNELKFNSVGGKWTIDNKNLHPRLTSLAAGTTAGATIWTLSLDPSFLSVTRRTRYLNAGFRDLSPLPGRIADPGVTKAMVRVVEDPRSPTAAPLTYLIVSPAANAGAGESVNIFLYFQNEDNSPPDSEHHRFRERSLLLGPWTPDFTRGQFGSTADYRTYPPWSWAYQLERGGADVLVVMPNVVPGRKGDELVTGMYFGDLGIASVGVARMEKLIWARWADTDPDKRAKVPPKLGKIIIGGWSSGMRTVFDWFHNDLANRVDGIFCFDAIGAQSGTKYAFPGGFDWSVWLDRNAGRKIAFLNGQYSQDSAILAAGYLTPKYSPRILLHEPADPAFWYDNVDFKAAHHHEFFPVLPLTGIAPTSVYVKKEVGKKQWKSYSLVLCHGSDPAKSEQIIANLSIHEAADMMYHELAMPVSSTVKVFKQAVVDLNHTGSPTEKDRAALERHTWSCSGGRNVGGVFQGYLELTLTEAVASGFLPAI